MRLEEGLEEEIREAVERLDRLIPKDGAHLTIGSDPDRRTTLGSRLGYLRFGVELLAAALRPQPGSGALPARIEPALDGLLTEGSQSPFELCEIDEAIASRPPVRTGLGAIGQILAGVLVVGALIMVFLGGAVVVRWIFG